MRVKSHSVLGEVMTLSVCLGAASAAVAWTSHARAVDECSTAIAVLNGSETAFDTTLATPSANPPSDTLCKGFLLEWNNSPDVWFSYTDRKSVV